MNAAAEPMLRRALAAQSRGDTGAAVAAFEKFLKAQPLRVDVMQHLAMLCRETGDAARALKWLRAAEKQAPDDASVALNLAGVLHESGYTPQALKRMRRAATLDPRNANAHFNLGVMLHDAGQFEPAADAFARAAGLVPADADIRRRHAASLAAAGRTDAAADALAVLVESAPGDARALVQLGEMRLAQGELDDASACATRALEVATGDDETHAAARRLVARSAWQSKDFTAALGHCEAGLHHAPADRALRVLRAAALDRLDRIDRAVPANPAPSAAIATAAGAALESSRDAAAGVRSSRALDALDETLKLGASESQLFDALDALGAFQLGVDWAEHQLFGERHGHEASGAVVRPSGESEAVGASPAGEPTLHARAARFALQAGALDVARTHVAAIPAGALDARALVGLGGPLCEQGLGDAMLPLLEAGDAGHAEVQLLRGKANASFGRRDAAMDAFTRAARLARDDAETFARAWFLASRLRRFGESDSKLVRDLGKRLGAATSDDARASLGFALGKMHADRAEHERAFECYCTANAAARKRRPYSRDARAQQVDACIRGFDAGRLEALRGEAPPEPVDGPVPLFIVGMTRSGTTLAEQILASHSDVAAGGELPYLPACVRRLGGRYPANLLGASKNERAGVVTAYRAALATHAEAGVRFVTDKLPANYMYLGLIATLLPDARIVCCERDPRDVCWSNFTQHFASGHGHTYDLGDLGFEYVLHARMLAHWKTVLAGRFFGLSNEALVDDTETQTRALLDACDLEFEPATLCFWETERAVGTASDMQVRSPVNRSSVGRWRPYAAWLGPLFETLGPALADTAVEAGALGEGAT